MKTNQFGYTIIVLLLLVEALIISWFFYTHQEKLSNLLITTSILALIFILFYRLKIVIDDKAIRICYGIGLIKTQFSLDKIDTVKVVNNSSLLGFGIRYTKGFTLYNIDGTSGIELTFKDGSQKVRIGTNLPNQLIDYINRRI